MVELPDDALEAIRRRSSSRGYGEPGVTHEDWARSVLEEIYPLIAARVRAEAVAGERQRLHVPEIAAHKRGFGVFCAACSIEANDYVYPCALGGWSDIPSIVVAAGSVPVATPQRPEIVVLCGSTRFKDAFREAAKAEALAGRIVLTVSDLDPRPEARHVNVPIDAETKARLDELHRRKIDLADRVLVLNVGGYIGESTRSEIEYATLHGKPITYLEPGPVATPQTEQAEMAAAQREVASAKDGARRRIAALHARYCAEEAAEDLPIGPAEKPVATPTEPPHMHNWNGPCPSCESASLVPAVQPDGWGEGAEAADHPVNCECPPCVIDRLRDSNDSLREQLSQAADEIDRLQQNKHRTI